MLQYILLSILVAGASAGYSSSTYAGGSGTGGFNSVGGSVSSGSGFAGSHAGAGFYPGFGTYSPVPPLPSPHDYSQFFHNLNLQFQNLYQQNLQQQQALFDNFHRFQQSIPAQGGGGYGSSGTYGGGSYGGPNYASSSAAYGPGGFHQTASIYPANPASPNVNTRFGSGTPTVTHSQGRPGFVGVSSSSFSSSSDVNGKKSSHREAVTSVNDNGKITTYHVRS
uniref:Putative secreted protein n=1 Tax=Corethrella appendiculata TaxID=1370023 RepID=U5ELX7_9DIPT